MKEQSSFTCLSNPCMSGSHGSQNGEVDPMRPELQGVTSHHVGARNQT